MRIMYQCVVMLAIIVVEASASPPYYVISNTEEDARYEPTWDSLDSRPLPKWYDEAKFGIFIHWGVFSVPSFGSEWFWENWQGRHESQYVDFMKKNYPPDYSYQDFAADFKAEFYDPKQWAEIFHSSGAKYVVLTTKHHEGYTLWPSKYSFSWNAKDVGPNRDLVGELADAIRSNTDLKFGIYHSLFEWFNPLYEKDKSNNFSTQTFVDQKTMPELYELVNAYKPEVVWSDGDGEATDTYWRSKDFLAWLYNDSPVKNTVVSNDRWGTDVTCKHGDFYTCADHFNPGVLQEHKWENCLTIDKVSWGFRRNAILSDFRTTKDLITELTETVSCGGNLLLNVGPTRDGIIAPIFEERLRDIGSWLTVNGEAIYLSTPWTYQNDSLTSEVWYTQSGDNAIDQFVYGIVLSWPPNSVLELGSVRPSEQSTVRLLGYQQDLQWSQTGHSCTIHFPQQTDTKVQWAWVLKFYNVLPASMI